MQVLTGIADTLSASGSTAAAPASGAAIATLATPPKGVYLVTAEVHESGTVDANALNGQLQAGATVLTKLPTNGSSTQFSTPLRVTLDGATSLTLNVGAAAGGAGAVYNGVLLATRLA